MTKPIYLPVEICQKLQAKDLESRSGMWYKRWGEKDVWVLDHRDFDHRTVPVNFEIYPAYELHIDILGSRENLEKLWPVGDYVLGWNGMMMCDSEGDDVESYDDIWQYMAHRMLDFILKENSDKAIDIITQVLTSPNQA